MNKKAFTLIELLVVVLIIGILAAVALPQYQKAVEKSKSAQAVTLLKSVYQAAQEYYLANGTWPTSFADLSITPPWTGTEKWFESDVIKDVLSDSQWSLQLHNGHAIQGLSIGSLSGKYKGGGFVMLHRYGESTVLPLCTIICAEKRAEVEPPDTYCQKVMQAKLVQTATTLRYYKMP